MRPSVQTGADHPGEPDGFERLWTPHRMVYIQGEDKPTDDAAGPQCPFCRVGASDTDDEAGLVVARGATTFVVLNLYPYNPGHVMVCPYRHAMRVLRAVSAPHGFNLGMNQGQVAGAGIAAHLHQHVVPRWGGDANFLPIVARTKALPELLDDTRRRLAQAWPR
jgi:ATP adenylyltransferase